jgi:transcriptional regulator with XRE-family HTH domain
LIRITQLGELLKDLRGKRSLRDIQKISGVSYTYLRSIEKGVDPRSGNKIIPTTDTLKKLAKAYNHPYIDLLEKAGHLEGVPELIKGRIAANYDTQIHLEGLLEDTLKVLTINNQFLDFLRNDVEEVQTKYDDKLEEGEKITPDWLKSLVSQAEWDQEWIWDLVKEFVIIAKKHDLDYEEIARKRQLEASVAKDLITILEQPGITYNGHQLTDQDKQRILDVLKVLLPEYNE